MGVSHPFVSAKADGADATIVRPTDWNADHAVNLCGWPPFVHLHDNANFGTAQYMVPYFIGTETAIVESDPISERIVLGPLTISKDLQLQKAIVEITGAYGAINFRICLYDHDEANDRPGALLGESGDLSANSTGDKTWDLTASEISLLGGVLYWVGINWPNTDTTGTVRLCNEALSDMISLGFDGTGASTLYAIDAASIAAACPDPFPSTHSFVSAGSNVLPHLWMEFID